jgi:FkbM family methyltransferase
MDYSNPWALASRRFGQKIGILRPIVRMWRRFSGYGYEDAFDRALLANISNGDVVWDIGANIGYYTRKFAAIVGDQGAVVAFEPSPKTVQGLMVATKELRNVHVVAVALSDVEGLATFYSDPEGNSPIDGLSPSMDSKIETTVPVRRGDDFLELYSPTKIKLDVEGYELEVLSGMPRTLHSAFLKAVFVEVHFQILAQRGKPDASADIVRMLRDSGFDVRWTDSSHICAIRK